MHVSLSRDGRVIQAGEGSFNVPMGADEVDNTLSSPVSQAEALAERNRIEYATMAALNQKQSDAAQARADREAYVQSLADEYEEYISAEAVEENGGENPLLYAAAMQSMAGGCDEQWSPISGYLLSQDGQLAYDRAMSGNVVHGMGQVQALIQSAQDDYKAAQAAAAPLIALAQGANPSAIPVAQAPASAPAQAPGAGLASLMSKSVYGIPAPYIAAGLLALLLLRKK